MFTWMPFECVGRGGCFYVCMFLSKNSLGCHSPGREGARSRAWGEKGVAGGKGEMAWNLLSRPGWLTKRPRGSCCVHLPSPEITRVSSYLAISSLFFSHNPEYGFRFLYSSQFLPISPAPQSGSTPLLVNKQASKGK